MMARFFKPAYIAITLMAAFILIGIGLALVYASLPAYLENRFIPGLAADAGLTEIDLQVRRVGLFGADLAQVRIGAGSQSALVFDSVQIDYTPGGLVNKTIQKVTLNGIEFKLDFQDGQLKIDDSLGNILKSKPPAAEQSAQNASIALPIKRLALRHARVKLNADDRIFTIPFELDLRPDKGSPDRMTIQAILWPRDQRFETVVDTDLKAGTASIQLSSGVVQLNAFADLIEPIAGLRLDGNAKVDGQLELALKPLKLIQAEGAIDWTGGQIQYRNVSLRPSVSTDSENPLWQLKVGTDNGEKWDLIAGPLVVDSLATLHLGELRATARPNPTGFEVTGKITAEPQISDNAQLRPPLLDLVKSPKIEGHFRASINRSSAWTFTFDGTPIQRQIELDLNAMQVRARMGDLHFSASGDTDQLAAEYKTKLDSLRLRSERMTGRAAVLSLKGKTTMPAGSLADQRTELSLSLTRASGGTGEFLFSGAKAGFYGTMRTNASTGPRIFGTARFSAAKLTAAATKTEILNASGKLPLNWPPPRKTGKPGQFKIESARFQRWKLANISGIINQSPQGIDVRGSHKNAIIEDLKLDFSGRSQLIGRGSPVIDFIVAATRPKTAAPIDLGTLLPGGKGMVYSGLLEGKSDLRVDAGGIRGRSSLNLKDGLLRASKENFKVSGIQLGLEMPGLPVLRSAPGQELQFAEAVLGDIQIKNGRIFFQLESAPAVLLEKGQFDWSEGRVDMHSTRIFVDKEDYELTLFCDRLNLARLLEQFGAADAEGTGTVSGKIPIRYKNKQWSVADGFLFSSPGEGGQIRVQGTEILTAGIPKNTPQYMQLEIAREALKDYNFDWAKLTVSTMGEDMLLNLQLDGRPAKTLPFTFQKDIGGFARVGAEAQGSKFQGIRLDVNFKLPLNKILQYKSIIQMMRKQ